MSHMNALLVGTVPFGFDLGTAGRTLVPNAGEPAIVAEVRAADAACESFSAIARGLDRGMTDEGQRARDPHPPPWHDIAAGAILVGLGAHWIQFAEFVGTVPIAVGVFQIVMVYVLRRRAALNLPPLWWGTLNRAFRRGAVLALGILVFVWFAAVVFGVWVIENMP